MTEQETTGTMQTVNDRPGSGASTAGPDGAGSVDAGTGGADRPRNRRQATVRYTGAAGTRIYEVCAHHGLLRTSAEVDIDGVPHDPVQEREAARAEDPDRVGTADWTAVRRRRSLRGTRLIVRRAGRDGTMADAETIRIRTVGLGRAGEVDVIPHGSTQEHPLAPEPGSASASHEERRARNPMRYAALAALRESARYLLPLLGIGAYLALLAEPAEKAVEEKARPVTSWLGRLLEPVGEALAPVGRFLGGVLELLLGWIPDWFTGIAIPIAVVALVFASTLMKARQRELKLEEARRRAAGQTEADGDGDTSSE